MDPYTASNAPRQDWGATGMSGQLKDQTTIAGANNWSSAPEPAWLSTELPHFHTKPRRRPSTSLLSQSRYSWLSIPSRHVDGVELRVQLSRKARRVLLMHIPQRRLVNLRITLFRGATIPPMVQQFLAKLRFLGATILSTVRLFLFLLGPHMAFHWYAPPRSTGMYAPYSGPAPPRPPYNPRWSSREDDWGQNETSAPPSFPTKRRRRATAEQFSAGSGDAAGIEVGVPPLDDNRLAIPHTTPLASNDGPPRPASDVLFSRPQDEAVPLPVPLASPIPNLAGLARSRLLRSPTPTTPEFTPYLPGTRPPTPNLPSLADLQRGLFRSNSVDSMSVARTMAMHKLTGGTETYDLSPSLTPPLLPSRSGRTNTVSGGERTAARQLMLNRLGGRLAKEPTEGELGDSSGEEHTLSLSSLTPKRKRRRSRRVIGAASANTSALFDSDFLSTVLNTPTVSLTPLPATFESPPEPRRSTPSPSRAATPRGPAEEEPPLPPASARESPAPSRQSPIEQEQRQPEQLRRWSVVVEDEDEDDEHRSPHLFSESSPDNVMAPPIPGFSGFGAWVRGRQSRPGHSHSPARSHSRGRSPPPHPAGSVFDMRADFEEDQFAGFPAEHLDPPQFEEDTGRKAPTNLDWAGDSESDSFDRDEIPPPRPTWRPATLRNSSFLAHSPDASQLGAGSTVAESIAPLIFTNAGFGHKAHTPHLAVRHPFEIGYSPTYTRRSARVACFGTEAIAQSLFETAFVEVKPFFPERTQSDVEVAYFFSEVAYLIAEVASRFYPAPRRIVVVRDQVAGLRCRFVAQGPIAVPLDILPDTDALSNTGYHESHSFPYAFPPIPEKRTYTNNLPPPVTSSSISANSLSLSLQTAMFVVLFVLFDFIPGQIYLHFLLRIPSLYFSRVTRIFEDARLSLPDIKRIARAKTDQWNSPSDMFMWPPNVQQTPDEMPLPRSLLQFRSSWEGFIDSLMREWKTFNIISVLLLSIQGHSHNAPDRVGISPNNPRVGAVVPDMFGTMRKMHKASSFANEAQKGTTSIWWNIWVLLAMPAIWLAWSIISFLTCIMSFIWLTGSSQDQDDFAMSPRATLGSRLGLTLVFALGVVYFVLVVGTFHRWGDPLDREWMRTVDEWMKEVASYPPQPENLYDSRMPPDNFLPIPPLPRPITPDSWYRYPGAGGNGDDSLIHRFGKLPASDPPLTSHPSAFFNAPQSQSLPASAVPVESMTIIELGDPESDVKGRTGAYADPRWTNTISAPDWHRFMMDISSAWRGQLALTRPAAASSGVDLELPAYTSLSVPPAPESYPPLRNTRTIIPSESSYGSIKPSQYMTTTEQSAPGSEVPAAATEIPIINAFTSTRGFSRSRTPTSSPPPTVDVGSGTSQAQGQQKFKPKPDHAQAVREFIALWNERYFFARNLQAFLMPWPREDTPASGPLYAITLGNKRSFPPRETVPDIGNAVAESGSPKSFTPAEDVPAM
ncbi:hypothetical protein MSAN_00742300 [Mycena sanguinolenta]|uniref:Transmembrane protein n=1 Tax=Mycena sanguinolenta TaxID=230812 RepID=A0A8H6Z2J2_9AGAR|nr:hypothetical protein MSAN_00742300 [Mycena sanguinolenta]